MERNFKLKPGDGVGIRIYQAIEYTTLGIGEKIAYPDGSIGFIVQGVSTDSPLGPFIIPQKTVEDGGFCQGSEEGTVWEFPAPKTYDRFSYLAWRDEVARNKESRIKKALKRFNLKRLVARIKGMV